eukprot:6211264-Pleurochrysis_carterae.AAC.1
MRAPKHAVAPARSQPLTLQEQLRECIGSCDAPCKSSTESVAHLQKQRFRRYQAGRRGVRARVASGWASDGDRDGALRRHLATYLALPQRRSCVAKPTSYPAT